MIGRSAAYLIGYWLGDGCVTRHPTPNQPDALKCHLDGNPDDLARVKASLGRLRLPSKVTSVQRANCWRIYPGVRFLLLLREAGVPLPSDSYTKSFDRAKFSPEVRWKLLEGLIDSDGCVRGPRGINYDSKSEALVKEIRLLCEEMGLPTSLGRYDRGPRGVEYRVYFKRPAQLLMKEKMTLQEKKQRRML